MNNTAVLNTTTFSLPNIELKRQKTIDKLSSKAEQAKLNLIYNELEEAGITFTKCNNLKELNKLLSQTLSTVDYNKAKSIIEKVNEEIDNTLEQLKDNSTNAFTKLMTGDLAKSIAKTTGIALAGRTALILAPTIESKALVALGLTGFSAYRIIKNRKEIKANNENNELNLILTELETTKDGEQITNTRFDEKTQQLIREQLKKMHVEFEDTGYRSLRQTLYSLDSEKKRAIVDYININIGKGIDVSKRVESAKKKLNLIASTSSTIGIGAKFGFDAANAINGVDAGLVSGALNGTVLGAWIEKCTEKEWFVALSSGLGFIGTEALERLPIIGNACKSIFAAENIVALTSIGATAGLTAGAVLGVTSAVKQIYTGFKNKKEMEEFIKLDNNKYANNDKIEFNSIKQKLTSSDNLIELSILDIIIGSLKDANINLGTTPKSIDSLKKTIKNLNAKDRAKAISIINNIESNLKDPSVKAKLEKAGKISIGMFTAGLAAMSVYDIIKGGQFLPELSQKLFPENNIYSPIEVPLDQTHTLNSNEKGYNESNDLDNEFNGTKDYKKYTSHEEVYTHELTGSNYLTDTAQDAVNESAWKEGDNVITWLFRNMGIMGRLDKASDYAIADSTVDKIAEATGIKIVHELVPDHTAITERLNELSPNELLLFMRYMNNNNIENNDMNKTIKEILQSSAFQNKVTNYIEQFSKLQRNHDFVNQLTLKFANGIIPLSTLYTTLNVEQKKDTNEIFEINNNSMKL